jgi:hypothetical protein
MPSTSPCGLGGSQNPDGSCTGTYGPSLNPLAHTYDGINATSVLYALLAAAALVAVVIFATWAVKRVANFFRKTSVADAEFTKDACRDDGGGPTAEWRFDDERVADRRRDSFDDDGFTRTYSDMHDAEDDTEDDTETDDMLEHDARRLARDP